MRILRPLFQLLGGIDSQSIGQLYVAQRRVLTLSCIYALSSLVRRWKSYSALSHVEKYCRLHTTVERWTVTEFQTWELELLILHRQIIRGEEVDKPQPQWRS